MLDLIRTHHSHSLNLDTVGSVLITKVRDLTHQSRQTEVIATAKTKQHIQQHVSTAASSSAASTVDPWTQGADPWGVYNKNKPTAVVPSTHVQQKLDDVETRLSTQVHDALEKELNEFKDQQQKSDRLSQLELQVQSLAGHQVSLETQLATMQQESSVIQTSVTQCHQNVEQQGQALQSVIQEVGTCKQTIAQQTQTLSAVATEAAGVRAGLSNQTSQLEEYFRRQTEQIEAMLAKRHKSEWLGRKGPPVGFQEVPKPKHRSNPFGFRGFWIFWFVLAHFFRIGEAAVPGPALEEASTCFGSPSWILPETPSFVLGVGNPSGINNKLHVLDSFGQGWFHLVETHASRYQQSRFQGYMKQLSTKQGRHIRTCVGAPAPLRSGSLTAGSWTGVLNFADAPLRQVPIRWPAGEFESGRVMVTAARIQSLEIVTATVYLPPKGPTYPKAAELSEQLLQPITTNLVLGRSGPRCICGDFNGTSDAYPQMHIWRQQGWQEIQEVFRDRFSVPVRKTCKNATTPDQLWCSPELLPYISNVALWDVWPDHQMVLAGLDLPALRGYKLQWSLPGHIPWEKIDKDRWSELAADTQWGPTSFVPEGGASLSSVPGRLDFDHALSQFDSTKAFHAWSASFENRVSACLTCPVAAVDHSFKGRGARIKPKRRRLQAPILRHSRQGEFQQADGLLNRSVGRWFQQLRRLQSYRHAALSSRASANHASRVALWNAILQAPGFVDGFARWWADAASQASG